MMKLNIQLFSATITTTFAESNLDTATNKSTLNITTYFTANNGVTYFTKKTLTCICNGVTKTAQVSHPAGGSVTYTFTFNNIEHDADGSKDVSWNWYIATGTSGLGTINRSGTETLTTINRASTIDKTGWSTASRPIEDALPLNINVYIENVYHKLKVRSLYGVELAIRNNIEIPDGEYEFDFTSSELNSIIYPLMTSKTEEIIVVELYTYTDVELTEQLGELSTTWYRGAITNANPTFTDFDYEDTNATTLALTGDSSIIVNKYSNLKVDIPTGKKAVAIKGATMTNYNVNGNLRTYADPFTYTINGINATELVVYAIDSRGNSKRVSKALNVKAYTDLVKLTQGATREDGIGTQVTFDITGTYWNYSFGSVTNNVTATYRYRIVGTESWTTGLTAITLVKSGANFSFNDVLRGDAVDNGFEIANGYEIEIIVSDKLTSQTFNCNISPSSPASEYYKNNISLGGTYDEELGGRVQLLGKYAITDENSHAKIEDTPINIINNLTTASAGLGLLDASQGKVLNDKLNYSTTEIIIGKWIDGKPLYRKTLSFTDTVPTNTVFSKAHGITNISTIWIDASATFMKSGLYSCSIPSVGYYGNVTDKLHCYVSGDNVCLYSNGGWGTTWTKVITLCYTKTTD